MKTTHSVRVDSLKVNDFIELQGRIYRIARFMADTNEMCALVAFDIAGDEVRLSLPQSMVLAVTRDDGLVGAPSHVVVDMLDGYTFSRDRHGENFTLKTAWAFAVQRNADSKRPTYKVFELAEVHFAPVDDQEA